MYFFLFFKFIFDCAGFSLQFVGFLLQWLLLFRSMDLDVWASVIVAPGLSCPVACGIFLDLGLNPCPLHWQEDS